MRFRLSALAALAVALALPAAAQAADPGRWVLTGATSIPTEYWQGVTADPGARRVYFVGVFEGLWRSDALLRRTAGEPSAIPADVKSREGYNHIGDPSFDPAEGGRVLLPLECYTPGAADSNPCDTGSLGVADADTLGWRYYVKLDPAEIPKAMWAETSPDGSRVWTSSGKDLLAYSAADVSPLNAGPAAAPIHSVSRLPGAVPPSGISGAVFRGGRLLLAGGDSNPFQVWSLDPATGKRRLEIETSPCGESEGLHAMHALGGELHWLIAPFGIGCKLTYGPTSALLHFAPAGGRAALRVFAKRLRNGAGRVRVRVRVTRRGKPVRGASVGFAGSRTVRANRRGYAVAVTPLRLGGRYKALARSRRSYGVSGFVRIRPQATGQPVAQASLARASGGR
jgi:hypothetical protein